jgi:hypothetical protein
MDLSQNHSPPLSPSMDAPLDSQADAEPTLIGRVNERTLELVRERPIACMVGALTVGFIVGKIASRY